MKSGKRFVASVVMMACLASLCTSSLAQSPVVQWAISAYGAGTQRTTLGSDRTSPYPPQKVTRVDASGNVYVAGTVRTVIAGSQNDDDFITLKYDSTGNEVWRAVTGGAPYFDDAVSALALDGAGDAYVLGTINLSSPNQKVLLVKYDASGQEVWRTSTIAGLESRALAVDDAGNAHIAAVRSGGGYVTTKISPSGSPIWTADVPGIPTDEPVAIEVDANGDVYVTGHVSNGVDKDYFTVKYNNAGAEQWHAIADGGAGDDHAYGLALATDGSVYVTGSSGPSASSDYMTIKYDSSGVEVWRRTLNSPGGAFDTARAIALGPAGSVNVSGSGQNGLNNDDYISVSYASGGSENWRIVSNSAGAVHDQGIAIAVDAYENSYVTGYGSDHIGGPTRGTTIKYDRTGSEVWRASMLDIGSSWDAGLDVKVTSSGSVYLAGNSVRTGQSVGALTIVKYAQPPESPTVNGAVPGNSTASLFFSSPPVSGGAPITGYSATCNPGAVAAAGSSSPLIVMGLTNGTTYSCTINAINLAGTGTGSSPVSVKPVALPLLGIVSRKYHGPAGAFDLPLDPSATFATPVSIEPRILGAGHFIVFHFASPITDPGTATAEDAAGHPVGYAQTSPAGNDVVVALSDVPDNQRLKISIVGVNGIQDASVTVGFVAGDVNRCGAVCTGQGKINAADISAMKAVGDRAVDYLTFRVDFNTDGIIDMRDMSLVKARSGQTLN